MTISLCLLLASLLMPRADFHWNRPQSQFLTTCAVPGGPTQYIDLEGAIRAGKSTPCVAKLARYAIRWPGIHMGAARWTQDALDAQIKPLWRMVAQERGLQLEWHGEEQYDEVVGTGSRVYLRALHASEDSQRYSKLAGLTLAVLWIDQPEEISNHDADVVRAYVPGRLSQVGYPHEVWYTPNPTNEDHWLSKQFPIDEVLPPNHFYIHTSVYDNRHILGEQYIADLELAYPIGTALRMRFIDGERGLGLAGEPVYAGYFTRVLRRSDQTFPWHVQPQVPYDKRFPIFEGWDGAYSHPAVLWSQYVNGQWRILAELLGSEQGLDDFADQAVRYRGELFPQAFRFESVCDPSLFARGAGLTGTVVELLGKRGIFMADYDTVKGYNHPATEYGAIQSTYKILRGTVGQGAPMIVIDKGCRNFALGMEAGYVWSDRKLAGSLGSVKVVEKQRETEYNHLQDCWLYTLLRFGGASMTFEQANRMQAKAEASKLKRSQMDTQDRGTWGRKRAGRGGY